MANPGIKWATYRLLLMVVAFGVGPACADWVVYEAETDLVLSWESFVNFRPNANWSQDYVVYLNDPALEGDPNDGWAALQLGTAGNWVTGVRIRAGYGPFYPDAFTDYTGAYKFWVCDVADLGGIAETPRDPGTYTEITMYPNWDTFEFFRDSDNHVWMETPAELYLDADQAFVVTSNWVYSFCDAMRIWADPCNCGDLGTVYLPEDLVPDCSVNMGDFAEVAADYGNCTDPADPCCGIESGVLEEAEDGLFDGDVLVVQYDHASGADNEVVLIQTQDSAVNVYSDVPGGNYMMYVRVRAGYMEGADPCYPEDFVDMTGSYSFYESGYEYTLVAASEVEFYSDTENYIWMRPTGPVPIGEGRLKVKSSWAWGFVDVIRIDTEPAVCGDLGTQYVAADLNIDCHVDLGDLGQLASVWLDCSDPSDGDCDVYWK